MHFSTLLTVLFYAVLVHSLKQEISNPQCFNASNPQCAQVDDSKATSAEAIRDSRSYSLQTHSIGLNDPNLDDYDLTEPGRNPDISSKIDYRGLYVREARADEDHNFPDGGSLDRPSESSRDPSRARLHEPDGVRAERQRPEGVRSGGPRPNAPRVRLLAGSCDDDACSLEVVLPPGGADFGGARLLEPSTIELKTELGVVSGTLDFSQLPTTPPSSGRRYYSFRALPYAEPPIGELRWSPPKPLAGGWPRGGVDGRHHNSFCPQYDHDQNKVVGNEDCLYLNVYTPFLPGETERLLPVLVFIHGGAYTRGAASSHGPQRLMTQDIVVVTMNYRLGVLGFLSTQTEELAGNYGALDQLAALQWVQQHISGFGGDPSRVTLGGFSAGAGFVHLHLLSPLSQGLFHRAIMMSGSGNCLWSVQLRPEEVAYQLAEDLDCPASSSWALKDCLKKKTAQELIQAQTDRHRYVYWPFSYRPVVDAGVRDAPFLPAPVHELLARPPASAVPVLGGTTRHEGVLFALTTILFSRQPGSASQVHDESAVYLLGCLWPNDTARHDIARLLHSFYYAPSARDSLDQLLQQMTEAMTDQLFTSCLWDALEHLAASTRAPVYTYLMTHHDPSSPSFAFPLYRLAQDLGIRSPLLQAGVSHGDDVILLFSFPHSQVQPGPRDLQMSALLTEMWANFVTTGSPQGGRLSSSMPPWSPLRPGEPLTFYRLSLTSGMVLQAFRNKERNLWQQTLPVAEFLSDQLEEMVSWQIATWVLSVLCVLVLVLLLLVVAGLLLARRRKKYPEADGATLRSRQPRSSTYGSPAERTAGAS